MKQGDEPAPGENNDDAHSNASEDHYMPSRSVSFALDPSLLSSPAAIGGWHTALLRAYVVVWSLFIGGLAVWANCELV